jgi:hypothetical protein
METVRGAADRPRRDDGLMVVIVFSPIGAQIVVRKKPGLGQDQIRVARVGALEPPRLDEFVEIGERFLDGLPALRLRLRIPRPGPLETRAASRRPACGGVLRALPRRLTAVSASRERKLRVGSDLAFPDARRPWVRTPEAAPLRFARDAREIGVSALAGRARPQAPPPSSQRSRRSAARVLMDEGWNDCKRGFGGRG